MKKKILIVTLMATMILSNMRVFADNKVDIVQEPVKEPDGVVMAITRDYSNGESFNNIYKRYNFNQQDKRWFYYTYQASLPKDVVINEPKINVEEVILKDYNNMKARYNFNDGYFDLFLDYQHNLKDLKERVKEINLFIAEEGMDIELKLEPNSLEMAITNDYVSGKSFEDIYKRYNLDQDNRFWFYYTFEASKPEDITLLKPTITVEEVILKDYNDMKVRYNFNDEYFRMFLDSERLFKNCGKFQLKPIMCEKFKPSIEQDTKINQILTSNKYDKGDPEVPKKMIEEIIRRIKIKR